MTYGSSSARVASQPGSRPSDQAASHLDLAGFDPSRLRAEAFARQAHAGQTDKAGLPYTGHLGRVAARAVAHAEALKFTEAEIRLCHDVGWLHDAVEDTNQTGAELFAAGFDDRTVAAVAMLTKVPGRDYLEGIQAIIDRGSRVSMAVKLADNEDNTDPSRPSTASLSPSLLARYEKSKAMLRAALRMPPLDAAMSEPVKPSSVA